MEAGKKAASSVLALETEVKSSLTSAPETAGEIAAAVGNPDQVETVYLTLEHLAANGGARIADAGHSQAVRFVCA